MRAVIFVCLTLAVAGFATDPNYLRAITEWRAQTEAALKADDGWLTVVGLDWLKEGENRVGSNPNLEIRLPKAAPGKVGTLTLKSGKVRLDRKSVV